MTKENDSNNPEGEEQDSYEPFEEEFGEFEELSWLGDLVDKSSLEVPRELHSCFSNEPFKNCIECGGEIVESGSTYVIQKARRNGETVLELAICIDCAQSMQDTMSVESRKTMETFLAGLMPKAENHPEGCCLSCSRSVDASEDEYEIAGLALGPMLLSPPILFCVDCHEELEKNLSEETRKGGEDFIEKNFPGIPADFGLPISFLGS